MTFHDEQMPDDVPDSEAFMYERFDEPTDFATFRNGVWVTVDDEYPECDESLDLDYGSEGYMPSPVFNYHTNSYEYRY